MRRIVILLFLFYHSIVFATKPTHHEVRELFFKSQVEENDCLKLIEILTPYNEKNNPLFFGYKGGATIIMAKYVSNPFSKISNFRKGRNMLEKAIAMDRTNSELIFLRFAIQTNIPSFLGYSNDIQEDKKHLQNSLPHLQDKALKEHISGYLKYLARLNKY